MSLPDKFSFTFMGYQILVNRYLSYDKWYYEWNDNEGHERCCLNADIFKCNSPIHATERAMLSVLNYLNGDPDKQFFL